MASTASQNVPKTKNTSSTPVAPRLMRPGLLLVLDAFTIWFIGKLGALGYYPLAAVIIAIIIFVNVVLLRKEAYPLRWMVVGLILLMLFTIYPMIFTIWVAFTNYGEGHLITKEQAVAQILNEKYLPKKHPPPNTPYQKKATLTKSKIFKNCCIL